MFSSLMWGVARALVRPDRSRAMSAGAGLASAVHHTPHDVILVTHGQQLTFSSLWLYDSHFARFPNKEMVRTWNSRHTFQHMAAAHGRELEPPATPTVRSATLSEDGKSVKVRFDEEGEHCFPVDFLRAWAPRVAVGATEEALEPEPFDLKGGIASFDCSEAIASAETRGKVIDALFYQGIVKLRSAPEDVSGDAARQITRQLIGMTKRHPLREADQFVMQSQSAIMEKMASGNHVDPPYFSKNTLLSHNDHMFFYNSGFVGSFTTPAGTGENGWVDAFAVAMEIRRQRPDLYDVLRAVPVTIARTHDRDASLYDFSAMKPTIETCIHGLPRRIRLHESQRRVLPAAYDQIHQWDEAYKMLMSLCHSDRFKVKEKTRPGDMTLFLNDRLLHDRIATEISSTRVLVGCFVELDVARLAFRAEMYRRHPHVPTEWSFGAPEDVLARMQGRKPCYAVAEW